MKWSVRRWMSAACVVLSTVLGCSSDPELDRAAQSSEVDEAFEPCPLNEGAREAMPSAECAKVEVPLRWEQPDGPKIKSFIKRLRKPDSSAQLWLVMGEPGTSAVDFEPFVKRFSERANADVYMLDHRGVGRSEPRLSCPDQEAASSEQGIVITAAEMDACAEHVRETYGDSVYAYTVGAAARDLGEMTRRFRDPNKKLLLYGVSYGTYLLQRYLQQFPADADGVMLDSLLAMHEQHDGHMPIGHAVSADAAGRELFQRCGEDPLCASKLGAQPNEVTRKVYEKLSAGHCPEVQAVGLTINLIKSALGFFSGQVTYRGAAPSLIHRLDRCGPGDVEALTYFVRSFYKGPFAFIRPNLHSWIVSANVERSEMWRDPAPTLEEHLAGLQPLLYTEYPPEDLVAAWIKYPFLYPHEHDYGSLPESAVPIMAVTGTLDASISVALGERYGKTLTRPYQHWLQMPNAAHIVLSQSPLVDDPIDTCGWQLAEQFFRNPRAELDTSCMQKVRGIDFASDPKLAYTLYNQPDLYD